MTVLSLASELCLNLSNLKSMAMDGSLVRSETKRCKLKKAYESTIYSLIHDSASGLTGMPAPVFFRSRRRIVG